jgi:hypothetical protein
VFRNLFHAEEGAVTVRVFVVLLEKKKGTKTSRIAGRIEIKKGEKVISQKSLMIIDNL